MPRLIPASALLLLVLTACAPAPSPDAAGIVQAAYHRLAAGDVNGFMSFFDERAIMEDSGARYKGAQAIRLHVENDIVAAQLRIELSNVTADRNNVTYIASIYLGNVLLANEPSIDVVVNGRILFDGTQMAYGAECKNDPSQPFCPGR